MALHVASMALSEICVALETFIGQQAIDRRIAMFACELDKATAEAGGPLMAVADRERVLQIRTTC